MSIDRPPEEIWASEISVKTTPNHSSLEVLPKEVRVARERRDIGTIDRYSICLWENGNE